MPPPSSTTAACGLPAECIANVAHVFDRSRSRASYANDVAPSISRLRAALAFTLVEMLVVMGVIVVLLSVTVPVFKNLVGGRGVEKSINDVSNILELARSTAIGQHTYTYVTFKNVVNADNTCELRCVAVASTNGLNYYDPGIMKPITKMLRMPSVKNVRFSQMPQAVKNVAPSDLSSDGSYIASWYATETSSGFPAVIVDGENFKGATYIQFNQDGGIGTSVDSTLNATYNLLVESKICIGLIATRGTALQTNTSDGAIVACYGNSGELRIVRP